MRARETKWKEELKTKLYSKKETKQIKKHYETESTTPAGEFRCIQPDRHTCVIRAQIVEICNEKEKDNAKINKNKTNKNYLLTFEVSTAKIQQKKQNRTEKNISELGRDSQFLLI